MFASESLVPEKRGIVMLKKVFCVAVCFVASLVSLPYSEAAITPFAIIDITVRVNGINEVIQVPCNGFTYNGADGRVGCNNAKYSYLTFGTPTWQPGQESQCKTYWDWVYTGYTGGGYLSFYQNCHGYAFGVGDWPTGSGRLIQAGGVSCWIQDMSNATIGSNYVHSIKIRVEDCPVCVGLMILEVYEKFRESGIYTKIAACSDESPLDLSGNGERAGMVFSFWAPN